MITLFGNDFASSPYVRKVWIVLQELGLEFEIVRLPLYELTAAHKMMQPSMRVPLLVDGGRRLFDSNVIIAYLFETYRAGAKPGRGPGREPVVEPPFAESMTRPERHWDDALLQSTIETMGGSALNVGRLGRNGVKPEDAPYLQRELARAESCLDWLEQRATAEGFWPGRFSVMDLTLISLLGTIDFRKLMDWRGRPKLEALVEAFQGRPSIDATKHSRIHPEAGGTPVGKVYTA